MAKQYVQHISKQGEKWLIETEHARSWMVRRTNMETLVLPREEYILCDPPERWTDVTQEIEYREGNWLKAGFYHHGEGLDVNRYRLRKMQLDVPNGGKLAHEHQWAFLVERKETP